MTLDADSLAAFCRLEVVDGVTSFMGSAIRVDSARDLISVHDVIMTLEGCTEGAARILKKKLTDTGKNIKDSNGFEDFKIGKLK